MSTVTSKDGTRIAYDKTGAGPAVILVDGAMSYRGAFDPTLAQLAELLGKHFTVYNYDRRGRGESGDTQPFAREREIEDLQERVARRFGFTLQYHKLELYGFCPNCRANMGRGAGRVRAIGAR